MEVKTIFKFDNGDELNLIEISKEEYLELGEKNIPLAYLKDKNNKIRYFKENPNNPS